MSAFSRSRASASGCRQPPAATVVDGIDYEVETGEVYGIAGESGSGKTMSVLALMGLLPPGAAVGGSAVFEERDLLRLPRSSCGGSAAASLRWSSRIR